MNKIIEAVNIKKSYRMGEVEVKALNDVSLDIYEGEFAVILGPSGSGKSTLLNIIGGMDSADEGKVFVANEEITKYNDRKLTAYRRNSVGFVFQFYNLMSNLTAKENVELATELCKNPLNIDSIIKEVGLWERKDHFPSQLSGGEQRRVAIARAVAKNPLLILCDEPTGALDYKTGIMILSLLYKINKDFKKTVVIISHNMAIGGMGDRIIKMSSGSIVENKVNHEPVSPERIEW